MKQTVILCMMALALTGTVQTADAASAATKFFRKWRHVDHKQQQAWKHLFDKDNTCDNRGGGEGSCEEGIKDLVIGG